MYIKNSVAQQLMRGRGYCAHPVYLTTDAEVHEQMSDQVVSLKSPSRFVLIYRTTAVGDERLTRPCPVLNRTLTCVVWKPDTPPLDHWALIHTHVTV
ncbi:hypothetical protein TNCV_1957011 [Trichonephila clavipes]|nr:hypothetical protein TNCV_1957011 [Trichonephila clavipes]